MTSREYILHWQETYDKNQSRPTTYAAHGYLFKNQHTGLHKCKTGKQTDEKENYKRV